MPKFYALLAAQGTNGHCPNIQLELGLPESGLGAMYNSIIYPVVSVEIYFKRDLNVMSNQCVKWLY